MMKSKPKELLPEPSEDDIQRLGLDKFCTCDVYDWDTICPYLEDVYDELEECGCCPYHARECGDDI